MSTISVIGRNVGDWFDVPAEYFTDHPSAEGSMMYSLLTHFEIVDGDEYAVMWSPQIPYTAYIWSRRV